MEARSKLELRVTELSSQLLELDDYQKKWVFDNCLEHKAFANKTSVFCLDCGEKFPKEEISRMRGTCPHCNTKLKVSSSSKRTDMQHTFVALTLPYYEFQVVQNFEVVVYYKKSQKPRIFIRNILEYWINDKQRNTMIGHLDKPSWSGGYWGGDWSIRKTSKRWNSPKYRVYPQAYIPGSSIKKEYLKIGITSKMKWMMIPEMISLVKEYPKAETLLKAKQYEMLYHMTDKPYHIVDRWNSIKICLRNKYKVKDAGIYFDYLALLENLGKDLRNAKYVCPKNLKAAHNEYVAKRQRQRDREAQLRDQEREEEERVRKAYLAKFPYKKRKALYMGLSFSRKDLKISFLESEKAIKEEGEILYHCIYTSEYQNKDTLLFSATVDGEKVATIEVDVERRKVLQVRGYDNNVTKWDNNIITLVQRNMKVIVARSEGKKLQIRKSKKQLEAA